MASAERGRRAPGPAGTPGRLSTLLALGLLAVVAATCVSLGLWQMDRAAQRDALLAAIEHGRQQSPLVLSPRTPATELTPWRAATVQGDWSAAHTVLLENRNLEGRPGYWVATPLLLDAARSDARHHAAQRADTQEPRGGAAQSRGGLTPNAVLVLRGWLPRDMQAAGSTPAVPQETGPAQVHGELHAHVPRIFELWQWAGGRASQLPDDLPTAAGAIPVVQNLDLADYERATGLRLLPAVLAQTQESMPAPSVAAPAQSATHDAAGAPASVTTGNTALRREWPGPSVDSDQNRGYALQWFSFAAIAAIAALLVARAHLRRSARRDGDKEST